MNLFKFKKNINFLKDAKPKIIITLNQKDDKTFAENSTVKQVLCEQQLAKVKFLKINL
jgi:hypothetical protein